MWRNRHLALFAAFFLLLAPVLATGPASAQDEDPILALQ